MRGHTIQKIYDKMLYVYCYVDIYFNQKIDQWLDYRANVKWIKENGPYKGDK